MNSLGGKVTFQSRGSVLYSTLKHSEKCKGENKNNNSVDDGCLI